MSHLSEPFPPSDSTALAPHIPVKRLHVLNADVQAKLLDEWLESFTPKTLSAERWAAIRSFVLDIVRASVEPSSRDMLYNFLRPVIGITDWAHNTRCLPLNPERIFTPENVEFWIAQAPQSVATAKASRSRLARVGRITTKRAAWEEPRKEYSRSGRAEPYSQSDLRALLRQNSTQPTPMRRHIAEVAFHVILGVGATGPQLDVMVGGDIRSDADGLHVRLRGPDRWVTCRREHETAVARLVSHCRPDQLVLGGANRIVHITPVLSRPSDVTTLSCARLRATYIVSLLADGVPLDVLLVVLGLKTSDGLAHFLKWLPARDTDEVSRVLRGAK